MVTAASRCWTRLRRGSTSWSICSPLPTRTATSPPSTMGKGPGSRSLRRPSSCSPWPSPMAGRPRGLWISPPTPPFMPGASPPASTVSPDRRSWPELAARIDYTQVELDPEGCRSACPRGCSWIWLHRQGLGQRSAGGAGRRGTRHLQSGRQRADRRGQAGRLSLAHWHPDPGGGELRLPGGPGAHRQPGGHHLRRL